MMDAPCGAAAWQPSLLEEIERHRPGFRRAASARQGPGRRPRGQRPWSGRGGAPSALLAAPCGPAYGTVHGPVSQGRQAAPVSILSRSAQGARACRYLGLDIVRDVVDDNQKRFTHEPDWSFMLRDITQRASAALTRTP